MVLIVEKTDYCVHKYLFERSTETCMAFVQFMHTESIFAQTFLNKDEAIHLSSVSRQQQHETLTTVFSCRQRVQTHAIDVAREASGHSGGRTLQVAALSSLNDGICFMC